MLYKLSVEKLLKLYNKTKNRSREPCASGAKAKATDRSQWLPQKEGREVKKDIVCLRMVGHHPHISAFLTWWSTFVFNHGGGYGGSRTRLDHD